MAIERCVDDVPDPEELSSQKQEREMLDHVLAAMPFELRSVFMLFELEGLTTDEIAAMLHVPSGTVSSRLRRGREAFHAIARRLRARMETRGDKP